MFSLKKKMWGDGCVNQLDGGNPSSMYTYIKSPQGTI